MDKLQFRVLYRQFLFRVFDPEVLSADARGDASTLLGQFAALLVFVSAALSFGAILSNPDAPWARGLVGLVVTMILQHFLIATTMLVVGVFAVLSWDATFPDRKDMFVLAPLPVRTRTMFLAKVAAVGASLGLTIVLLHGVMGFIWPLVFFARTAPVTIDNVLVPASVGFSGLLRSFAAYWFTMLAAGVFTYGAILGTQGLASLALPRRLFLRVSGYLQLVAIGVIVLMYFLQPGFRSVQDLLFGSVGRVIQWLPSYWFLALYQQLNGSMHPALAPLAKHAWAGLAVVVCGTPLIYMLSYWRTLGKIVEEPDIAPSPRRRHWLPRFGTQGQTAIVQFSVRTMARSKQHRLILGFYWGIGLAFTSLMLKASSNVVNSPWRERSMVLWAASILMIVLAAVGTRVAFALPVDLRANWIFRVTGVHGGSEPLAAGRRALLLLSVLPVWVVTAVACMMLWQGLPNVVHLVLLGCLGLILADVCLLSFRKIPFTCSYLPGKSRFHIAFLGAMGMLWVCSKAAMFERDALRETSGMVLIVALLIVVWICIRRITVSLSERGEQELLFEEEAPPVLLGLGLQRDRTI